MANGEAQNTPHLSVIKNWHVVLTLIAWLVITVAQFITVRTQADETARRVQELEGKKVDQNQFNELREDIIRRLDRIESKVDRERSLRDGR